MPTRASRVARNRAVGRGSSASARAPLPPAGNASTTPPRHPEREARRPPGDAAIDRSIDRSHPTAKSDASGTTIQPSLGARKNGSVKQKTNRSSRFICTYAAGNGVDAILKHPLNWLWSIESGAAIAAVVSGLVRSPVTPCPPPPSAWKPART